MQTSKKAVSRSGLAALVLVLAGVGAVMPVAMTFALPVTLVDDGGADDAGGQKDLSQITTDAAPLPDSLTVTWNWDDTSIFGSNTLDACSLFDTDNDGKANYALCVTAGGNPVTHQSTTLWSCDDSKSDRCSGNSPIGSFSSTCTAAVEAGSDPFASAPAHANANDCNIAPKCFADDTVARCTVKLSDFGTTNAFLINVCSFPSAQPNLFPQPHSSPADCAVTPDSGFLTIVKDAGPDTQTTFTFELGTGQTSQSGENTWSLTGSDSVALISFAPGTYDLNEVVPAGWALDSASCVLTAAATGTGTPPNTTGVTGFVIQSGLETVCTFTNVPSECDADADCDDNNACTDDSCNVAAGSCEHTNNTAACNDNNACTQTDTCQAGVCTGGNPVTCTAQDQCHGAGTCNPSTGQCSNPAKADGASCSDGNACTQTDSCQTGVCTGGNPVTCTAQDQCHGAGTCDPSTGQCSNPNAPDGTMCDDGNSLTTGDACQGGFCIGKLPPASVCGNGIIEAGEECDDADTKSGDGCSASCQIECENPAADCPQAPQCQVAVCVKTAGGGATCKTTNKVNGTACDDGNAATPVDQCFAGTCLGGFATPACSPVCGPASCPPPTMVGTLNSETLSGTIGNDVIAGNGGNDKITALEGDDCITAGSGNDRIEGHKGNDKIIDTGGTNVLAGGENDDCIFSGSGNDTITGDEGCDVIIDAGGTNVIKGYEGSDVIVGGPGIDTIYGGEGDDVISGGEGDDLIDGGPGIDSCDGGPGIDTCKDCEIKINCEK